MSPPGGEQWQIYVLGANVVWAQQVAFAPGIGLAEGEDFGVAWAGHRPGYYDLVHSHYWLSGHVGWLAAQRW
ncbi:hypothetical protein AB0D38_46080, partial [Streptomyces sp. NPDC048279]